MSTRRRTVPVADETAAGLRLNDLILLTFRLNGRLLDAAEAMADAGGLTAARWQVLGAVLDQPRTVSDIARQMGLTRQAVQRLADAVVADGFATWETNPSHKRAKLLSRTDQTFAAIDRIAAIQHPWANAVGAAVGEAELARAAMTAERLLEALQDHPPGP